ncbi:MAG: aldehyde dehydrogenase (NADP(+)) [Planctomycetota bacterium]
MAGPVLIAGEWREADASSTFKAVNPRTTEAIPGDYPVSSWSDLDAMLQAAVESYRVMRLLPAETLAAYLDLYASKIEAHIEKLAEVADEETALGKSPRFMNGEIPRTINQLQQAAAAARDGSWSSPTIDTGTNLRSIMRPLGVVCVFGPNNFPFAYNGVAGGDFASAIAAGNPVIAKGHPSHPRTSQMLAELAFEAVQETGGMPSAAVQFFQHTSRDDGIKLMADPRHAALGFTGSRPAGMALKKACEDHGKLAYLEMSSINPVVLLPGALSENLDSIVEQFLGSVLLGCGQFCTNPGLVLGLKGQGIDAFIAKVTEQFNAKPGGTLLNEAGQKGLAGGIETIKSAGATCVTEGSAGDGFSVPNTLLTIDGGSFLESPKALQTEAFGNSSLVVIADDIDQLLAIVRTLEGNLTGGVYSAEDGSDDEAYAMIEPDLSDRVGRLLNDKMPTGVAVVASQNHGGPYPASGHPGFTAVGFPASLRRFAKLTSYDNVRQHRLPALLQDENPGNAWRLIDGQPTQQDVPTPAAAPA